MAKQYYKRTVVLGLDYSEFSGGTAEINSKMKLLESEFKLASENAKEFGNESDQLGLKQDKLKQKIILQAKAVEEAKKKYNDAIDSGKASQKTIDNLDKALLDARTALQKSKNELAEVDDKIKHANDDTESFGDAIRGIANDLGMNVSPALEKFASKFDKISKSVGTAIVGIGAIVTTFTKLSVDAATAADDLNTLSSVTGITTDELQKLQYASKFVDVSVDQISDSLKDLKNNMYSAANGSSEFSNVFKKLRVNVTGARGELRDANDVFYECIDALGHISNETERDAMAMKIFGESAKNLNPLIEAGGVKLKELGIEAENMGAVMEQGALDKLQKLKDAMDKFENTTDALKNSLGLTLLPLLTALFTAISNIPAPVLKTIVVLASVIATIMLIVKAIKSVTDTGKTIKSFFDATNASTLKTTAIIMGVVAALIALATVIAVIAGKSNDLKESMNTVASSVANVSNTVSTAQTSTVKQNAFGTDNFSGGETWVGESGPERVTLPRGSRIESAEQSSRNETYNVYMSVPARDIRQLNDVYRIVKTQTQRERRS